MVRTVKFEVPTDTSQFTYLQIQPKALLSLSWNGYARWLREHLFSLPNLIREHHLGTVIIGTHIDYLEPLTFFDSDTLEINVELQLWARQILVLNVDFSGAGRRAAHVYILLYPLEIKDPETLAAVPTTIAGKILDRFQPDEVDSTSSERQVPKLEVPELVQQIEQSGQLLTERLGQFSIHHHLCEVAEQWSFIEVPGIVESVREPLALEQHEKIPELRQCLSQPLQSFKVELTRPYFVFEQGQVEARGYLWRNKLVFIHRLFSERFSGEIHGTIIEQF